MLYNWLQFFANPNTQTTGTGTLSDEMKTFYTKGFLDYAKPNLVHAQFAKKQPLPRNGGKTVEWRKMDNFKKALVPLTEGVTPDGTGVNVSAVTATVSQYGDYTTLSDVLDMTAIDPLAVEITERHGFNAGLTFDTIVRNEIQTGTNVNYAPQISGGVETPVSHRYNLDNTAVLTAKEVNKAVTSLKKLNAPKINGEYVAIIHPSVAFDLRQDQGWLEAHKYASPEQLFNGEIGKLHGVRFVETTEAKIYRGAGLHNADNRTLTVDASGAAASTGSSTTTLGVTDAIDATDRIAEASATNPIELLIGGKKYVCVGATVAGAGSANVKIQQPHDAIAASTTIYAFGGGAGGVAVYGCLFMGKDAYDMVDIEGGNIDIIVKPLGAGDDPLNQRSTIGWKGMTVAKLLYNDYIVRVECGSTYGSVDEAN